MPHHLTLPQTCQPCLGKQPFEEPLLPAFLLQLDPERYEPERPFQLVEVHEIEVETP